MSAPRPLIVGHRGAARLAPENTLASFRAALRAGAVWVEFDVRFSRDGVPVVIHDPTLDRTTDGSGPVRDHDLSQIGRLDAGSWFDPRFHGERVPTLRAVLGLLAGRAGADIEIKQTGADVKEALSRVLEEVRDSRLQPFVISSFAEEAVAEAARRGAPAGLLIRPKLRGIVSRARAVGARTVVFSTRQATPRRVARIREGNLSAWIYTVNERAAFEKALKLRFEAVISDRPDLLRFWRDG